MNNIAFWISIISFILSIITCIITYRFNKITLRNTAKLEHNKLLLEIDKILIEHPNLWGVYDNHYVTSKSDEVDVHLKGQKEAFIYYYINLFDVIYEFYNRQIIQNKNDKKLWIAWTQFIEHFFRGSTQAREILKKSYHLYDGEQMEFYKEIINKIEG
jgi:hypothetical protein